jgi:uncharacterized SAM-binding protein YcdF (DUF218 family)
MLSDHAVGRHKTVARLGIVLVFIFAVAWFFRTNLLTAIGYALVADNEDGIADGDPAVLLMGDSSGERVETAFRFLNAHPGSHVMIGREESSPMVTNGFIPHAHEVHRKVLTGAGIAEGRIVTPGCINTSTLDEARCAKKYLLSLEKRPAAVVVVTSWYHSGRAYWLFSKVFAGSGIRVRSYVAIRPGSTPSGWWEHEIGFLSVFSEYLKWTYWFFNQDKIAEQ